MTRWVVDASVAIKWFVPEVHSDAALRLLDGDKVLLAPDLLIPELGNIVWKKVRRGEMDERTGREVLRAFALVPLQIHPSRPLLDLAFDVAHGTGTTVYDGMYVALATTQGCPLATADRKLLDAQRAGPLKESVVWVENLS